MGAGIVMVVAMGFLRYFEYFFCICFLVCSGWLPGRFSC